MRLSGIAGLIITGTAVGIIAAKLFTQDKKSKASKGLLKKSKNYKKLLDEKSSKKRQPLKVARENIKTSGLNKICL